MAKRGFRVMDSDMHVVEPADLWQRYLDPVWRHAAPVGTATGPRDIGLLIRGAPANRPGHGGDDWSRVLAAHMGPRHADYAFAERRGWDGVSQLEAMEREGIDVAVCFPSRGLFVLGLDSAETAGAAGLEPAFAAALARAYNDWLHDFLAPDRERLVGAAMVAPHDVASAVAETRRAVVEYGFRAIFLLPGRVNRRPWHDRRYDPLWGECERLGIPVVFHGGGPDLLTEFGLGFGESLMMWHTFSHCLGPMAALVSLIGGGVFDRFPRLRAGFLEGNCSWAPWLLHRLDDHYADYVGRHEIELALAPSAYFRRNCFVSVEADEAPAGLYVQTFGDDNVAFSTDYPHPDAKFPHAVERFLELPLADATRRKFLWDNCARLYGLER
jgi:predicted TIM-barrel fold metal-dependent hydrolase